MSTEEVGASQPGGSQPAAATGAVFLSYASEDAAAAERIATALRAAGVEVWFDKSELRGGDAWDRAIRQQIKNCALFIPIISRHTHERAEGYFRLEWKLAVDRSHLIAADKAFLVPVVIDDTPDDDERVPDRFREVQWTRLPEGETPPEFVIRVGRLLAGESAHPLSPTQVRASAAVSSASLSRLKPAWLALGAVLLFALFAYLSADKLWLSRRGSQPPTPPPAAANAFAPPSHSIAVLPFVNMSGDKEQEYFSDGLTEEILNSLARINELQVSARTSSFAFKGRDTDIGTIARKLNVGAILEGSVRRSAHTIRITAQLDNAVTGFHLWSQTYDRDLGDVLTLQTDIATEVASALKVSLLGDAAPRIELGGTRNSAAFDAYLRGWKAYNTAHSAQDFQTAVAEFTEAINQDPGYALALAARSMALLVFSSDFPTGAAARDANDRALADARKAVRLAPQLGEAHLALAFAFEFSLNLQSANEEYEHALTFAPGNVRLLGRYSIFAAAIGHTDDAVNLARRAVSLDPLNPFAHGELGQTLLYARRYGEAIAAFHDALVLYPSFPVVSERRGLAYYALGKLDEARSSCDVAPPISDGQVCLAIVYDKLGRHADAEAMLATVRASQGDTAAYQYAETYAQWGSTAEALKWLETALRLRNSDLIQLRADLLLDPLRKEARFQAIERELNFPH